MNLTDGGAEGLDDWEDVPKDIIKNTGHQPFKVRTKSFKDLERLALQGIEYHWGRNSNHTVAKHVEINGERYEMKINAVNTAKHATKSPKIIYNTNQPPGRSRNWELSRILYYNTGYLDFSSWYQKADWIYRKESFANNLFKETGAHEMGHEILLAYGGHGYSKKHKDTSTILQSENAGLKYPNKEIDLMKYYDEEYAPDFNKVVASEKDVISLLWLNKFE